MAKRDTSKASGTTTIERRRLSELRPDTQNANKGTERGSGMLERSLRDYGAGRSVLVDKNGVVIAGNKTVEAAASLGFDDVIMVPTDGRTLVVVQRTDLDLSTDAQAKALGVADNRVSEVGLSWDADVVQDMLGAQVDLSSLFSEHELARLLTGATAADAIGEDVAGGIQGRGMGTPVISYTIIFDNKAQQDAWFEFIKVLRQRYADAETIADRIVRFVREHA